MSAEPCRDTGARIRAFEHADGSARAAFATDGVIRLTNAFGSRWIQLACEGIAQNLRHPGPFFRDHTSDGAPGRYVFDFWTWPEITQFRELVFESPAGRIASQVMGVDRTTMVMDNWFLREPGATDAAPWHHDEPYFDFEGQLCILWLPLEPVANGEGLSFVRGSHRLGQLFAAQQFSANVPFACSGDDYVPMPDFSGDQWRDKLITSDLELGDCLLFDFRTIHAATNPNTTVNRPSHRMTLRFASPDTVFRPRGPWTRAISDHLIAHGQKVDAPLDCALMPEVWPRQSTGPS